MGRPTGISLVLLGYVLHCVRKNQIGNFILPHYIRSSNPTASHPHWQHNRKEDPFRSPLFYGAANGNRTRNTSTTN